MNQNLKDETNDGTGERICEKNECGCAVASSTRNDHPPRWSLVWLSRAPVDRATRGRGDEGTFRHTGSSVLAEFAPRPLGVPSIDGKKREHMASMLMLMRGK